MRSIYLVLLAVVCGCGDPASETSSKPSWTHDVEAKGPFKPVTRMPPYTLFDPHGRLVAETNDPVAEPKEPMSAIKDGQGSPPILAMTWHSANVMVARQGDRVANYPPIDHRKKDPTTKTWPTRVLHVDAVSSYRGDEKPGGLDAARSRVCLATH